MDSRSFFGFWWSLLVWKPPYSWCIWFPWSVRPSLLCSRISSGSKKSHSQSLFYLWHILTWERLKAEGEEGDREWDGWMASPKHWTWTWANSGRWWGARKPGMLQSMGSGRVRYDWGNEQQILACQWPLCLNFLTHLCEFFESLRSSKIFGRLWRIIFSSQTQLHDPFPSNGLRLF